ncbi:DivIVA domain-containing protein [Saccharomonospora glauca]|jgi:DivIVA domain-containing protein|uniref:Cell wall synthesis protein Wag31 n=1 Tax=Saccharomonospora glauca K62 TaxID=928724 RepID=I1D694_9PSEU|nr:DivIVA domain-containing protein [Saccharomonospora glauca]EIF00469.1 DivIVA domain protein [Saccharomonospora glauca K62]
MPFTADDVHEIQFDNAPFGRRGYSKTEVDSFVHRIAETLAGRDDVTAAEVHHVQFGRPLLGRRGYDEQQVDEFLDEVERQLAAESELRRSTTAVEVHDR